MSTNLEKLSVPFTLNPKKIANLVEQEEVGMIGYFLLFLNILAVGVAAMMYKGPVIGFIPEVSELTDPGKLLAGMLFQLVMISFYSYSQRTFLKLFNINLSNNETLQLIAYASVWFSVGVLFYSFNIYLGFVFTAISFLSLVLSHQFYIESDFIPTFIGVTFASIITGLAAFSFTLMTIVF